MPFAKGNTYGNRFEKGKTGNATGRPKMLHNEINHRLQLDGKAKVTKVEFTTAIRQIMNLTESELNEIQDDADTPVFLKWIITDLKCNKTRPKIMLKLLKFVFG